MSEENQEMEEKQDQMAQEAQMADVAPENEGRDDERTAVALDMLADNEPIEKIVKYSHLPESKILELRDSRATYSSK